MSKKHVITTTNHPGFNEMVHHGKHHPGFEKGAARAMARPMPQPQGGNPMAPADSTPMQPMPTDGPGAC